MGVVFITINEIVYTFYVYLRVSTKMQDIGRQIEAINKWKKANNITINEENIYTDYYTGKSFDRDNYQAMKSKLKKGDYLVIKEVDRLGRDWDGIKKEWQELKDNGINIIILEMPILSDNLPSERPIIDGLDMRLIKEQILSLMCYSAQKEREKISLRTKEQLAVKKKEGKIAGRPIKITSGKDNFIKVLSYMVSNNTGQKFTCNLFDFPVATFKVKLKECYKRYNSNNYCDILTSIQKDEWNIFETKIKGEKKESWVHC